MSTEPASHMSKLPECRQQPRARYLKRKAYIIGLTFGRARIVADEMPKLTLEPEFW